MNTQEDKSMAIKVTPDELEAMAKQLTNFANQAKTMADSISKAIQAGTAAWEGDAAKDYAARFNEIKPVLTTQLPELITAMSKDAKTRAQRYRDADKV